MISAQQQRRPPRPCHPSGLATVPADPRSRITRCADERSARNLATAALNSSTVQILPRLRSGDGARATFAKASSSFGVIRVRRFRVAALALVGVIFSLRPLVSSAAQLAAATPPDAVALCRAAERADKPWASAVGAVAAIAMGAAVVALVMKTRRDTSDTPETLGEGEAVGYLAPFALAGLLGGGYLGYRAVRDWGAAGASWRACTPEMVAQLRGTSLYRRWNARGGGFASVGFYSALVGAGLFLRPNLLLEVSGGGNMVAYWDRPSGGSKTRITGAYGLLGRVRTLFFLGRTFYLGGGMAARRFTGQASNRDYRLHQTDLDADIAVGNRWYEEDAFFGIEWLSLQIPLVKLSRQETPAVGGPVNGFEGPSAQNALRVAGWLGYGFLTVTMGLSF
jgi:hypothetical protein